LLQVFGAVVRHVDWAIVKCLVIAGPGFAKDTFKTYLEAEAVRRDVRPLIENKASIITAQVREKSNH
jgi:protein pelota